MNDGAPERSKAAASRGLSEWEPREGLLEFGVESSSVVRMSVVAPREQVHEITPRDKLQEKTLSPIVSFFIWANSVVGVAVLGLAIIEMFLPPSHATIVTDKVIIALISGLTIQVGAVIIAAFKGLFSK
ncbi:MAG: hypothetical protein WAU78_17705 [Roseiarcus sp.]